jgi:hypothetical protein
MFAEMTGLPGAVIGFKASGTVHAEDYRDVLLPAIERAASAGPVRVVLVFEDFEGLSAGALWQDLRVGVEHLRGWRRIAVVTDIEWMSNLISMFGWMTPGEVKTFPLAERDTAIDWAAG